MPAIDRARRVGAVRRRRDQHDVAVRVAAVAVVGADHHQPGELALRAGVRLQRDRREAGDLAERRFELAEDLLVALPPARPARTDAACANSGQVIGSISDAAFSFIVHEPSGIIDVSRPMSLRSRLRM